MPKRVMFWVGAIRAPFFVVVIIPSILGTVIAWANTGKVNWAFFILATIGAMGVNSGTNLINDYFDHKSKNDEINKEFLAPFTGGSRFIQNGLLTPATVFVAAMLSFLVVAIIGIYFVFATGWPVLVIGLIGVFCGYFYSAPPFRLGHKPVGEAIVGINCGILVTLGAYWVQTQTLAWQPVIAAIPSAILVAAILWINEFPDYAADQAVGKIQLMGRLGKPKAAKVYSVIMLVTYVPIVFGVIAGVSSGAVPALAQVQLPVLALLSLLTLPLALRATRVAMAHYQNTAELAPANVLTIKIMISSGLLLAAGFFFTGLIQNVF